MSYPPRRNVPRALSPALVLIVLLWAGGAHARTTISHQGDGDVVITGTLEAAPAYPRVWVQLRRGGRVVTGEPMRLGRLKILQGFDLLQQGRPEAENRKVRSFRAFLDTGASGYVIGHSTAQRFDIEIVPGSVYYETGLQKQIPMRVSRPYTIALSGTNGKLGDRPQQFTIVDRRARLQVIPTAPDNPLIALTIGSINVVGMPAIRKLVVEIIPRGHGRGGRGKGRGGQSGAGAARGKRSPLQMNIQELIEHVKQLVMGPVVRLHPPNYRPRGVDLRIDLKYVDYNRPNNPRNRGPVPALAKNPTIQNITAIHNDRRSTGDWLLDTGAPVSIISTRQAMRLGLYDQQGNPVRAPDFQIPLGGISGKMTIAPGFVIDRLRIPTQGDRALVYRNVSVLVHDVGIKLGGGKKVILDGIFGTNLLLSTLAGLGRGLGLPTEASASPYRRVWIHGPKGLLLLDLARGRGQ